MSGEQPSARMTFTKVDASGAAQGAAISAQFNPTSLQYAITNTAKRGGGEQRQQRIDDSSAKLTFDLIFDNTHDGKNVRLQTQSIAVLMEPQGTQKVPPQVKVDWGDFSFTGVVDSYKENIDFFSEDGVPLRATVSLSLSNTSDKNKAPKNVFEFATPGAQAAVDDEDFAVDVPVGGRTATDVASESGDPSRGRDVASQNGLEDPRNPGADTDTLTLDDGQPQLGDPIAFAAGASAGASAGFGAGVGGGIGASASAGFGASAGAGFSAGISGGASAGFSGGASAGFSGGASAGFSAGAGVSFGASASASAGAGASFGASASAGASAGASFGASAGASAGFSAGAGATFGASAGTGASFGASASTSAGAGASFGASAGGVATFRAGGAASAGVSATAGAFSLLRAPATPQRRSFTPSKLIVRQETSSISTRNATFAVGGRIKGDGSSGFSADVGATTEFGSRIEFEED